MPVSCHELPLCDITRVGGRGWGAQTICEKWSEGKDLVLDCRCWFDGNSFVLEASCV